MREWKAALHVRGLARDPNLGSFHERQSQSSQGAKVEEGERLIRWSGRRGSRCFHSQSANGKQSSLQQRPNELDRTMESHMRVARGIPTRSIGSKIQISITSRPRSGTARTRAREGQRGHVGRCRSCNSHMAEWHQCRNPGRIASVLDYIHSDGGSLDRMLDMGRLQRAGSKSPSGKARSRYRVCKAEKGQEVVG